MEIRTEEERHPVGGFELRVLIDEGAGEEPDFAFKVGDFGIARIAERDNSVALTTEGLGALLDRLDPATCAELGIPRAAAAGETTGPEVAAIASRGLRTGVLTPAETRTVCASALTQVADRGAVAPADARRIHEEAHRLLAELQKADAAAAHGEAERLLAALRAADADLRSVADAARPWAVFDDDGEMQGCGDSPIAALRAAFPEVADYEAHLAEQERQDRERIAAEEDERERAEQERDGTPVREAGR